MKILETSFPPGLLHINRKNVHIGKIERFPSKDIVYNIVSLLTIVKGIPKVDTEHKNIAFSTYAMVHIGTTNTIISECVPEIELKASNDFGVYYFMNKFTRKRMNSYNWKKIQIIEEVIEEVEKLNGDKRRPVVVHGYSLFEWRPGIEINETMKNDEE